jgi:transcriptional regulator with XRE-family HTH domain
MSDEPASIDALGLGVGQSIRRVRSEAGISMRALALRCGVSQPFISEVERGMSMPSIATLYRIAEALQVPPSTLLPSSGTADVHVVRQGEGRSVASSERPNSAVGRVVFSNEVLGLEVYEYVTARADDLDVWFQHDGHKVLHLIEGRLDVEFEHRAPEHLGPGDTLIHPGSIAHRWTVRGDDVVRLFLVVTR